MCLALHTANDCLDQNLRFLSHPTFGWQKPRLPYKNKFRQNQKKRSFLTGKISATVCLTPRRSSILRWSLHEYTLLGKCEQARNLPALAHPQYDTKSSQSARSVFGIHEQKKKTKKKKGHLNILWLTTKIVLDLENTFEHNIFWGERSPLPLWGNVHRHTENVIVTPQSVRLARWHAERAWFLQNYALTFSWISILSTVASAPIPAGLTALLWFTADHDRHLEIDTRLFQVFAKIKILSPKRFGLRKISSARPSSEVAASCPGLWITQSKSFPGMGLQTRPQKTFAGGDQGHCICI